MFHFLSLSYFVICSLGNVSALIFWTQLLSATNHLLLGWKRKMVSSGWFLNLPAVFHLFCWACSETPKELEHRQIQFWALDAIERHSHHIRSTHSIHPGNYGHHPGENQPHHPDDEKWANTEQTEYLCEVDVFWEVHSKVARGGMSVKSFPTFLTKHLHTLQASTIGHGSCDLCKALKSHVFNSFTFCTKYV